jgi:hypothetical protein
MSSRIKIQFIILILIVCLPILSFSQNFTKNEYNAAVTWRIAQFVTWSKTNSESQFLIGVYDDFDGAKEFRDILSDKTLKNLPIKVIPLKSSQEIGKVDILFLPDAHGDQLEEIINIVGKNTLIISDNSKKKEHIMINLLDMNSNNKFELNIKNILYADLEISKEIVKLGGGKEANWQDLYNTSENQN